MQEKKAKNSALVFIFLTVLIDMIGVGIIVPIIPDLISSLTGQNLSDAALTGGLLITAYAGVQFLFAPVMGELSDSYGRKPILLLSLFGLGVDYVLHAFAPTIMWLFAGRILAGIFGASHTVAFAYIADVSNKENKAKNFGIIGAAFGLGFVIGPAIGGIIGENWGVKAPFFVAAGFSLLNFLFGLFFVKESLAPENRRKINYSKMIPFVSLSNLRKYKAVIGFVIAFGLAQLAGQVMPNTWSYYTMERYEWNKLDVGLSLMVVGILASVVQALLTGFLVKRFGNKKVIMCGFTLWTLGMFGIAFAGNAFYLYAATIPYVVGGIATPTIQGVVSNRVSDKEQGNLQGVLTSLGSLMAVLAPVIYTTLFSVYSGLDSTVYFPGAPFLAGASILIIATIIAIYSLRNLLAVPGESALGGKRKN
ncbi:MAG: TCR/Tet family MFS transporter [Crocinitomix sp.]|nr:TCR/Tet family MFS transporter [Crocinitomix sp.]